MNNHPLTDLTLARINSWQDNDNFFYWDNRCKTIRERIPKETKKILRLETDSVSPIKVPDAHQELFGTKVSRSLPTSKEANIKFVLAQIYSLLSDTKRCLKYLRYLNDEFSRYLMETNGHLFKNVDPNSYEFKFIQDLQYPIPTAQFIGQHKNNALDKFLIALFSKYSLRAKSYQWIGFIPRPIANLMAIEDYIKENNYGVALFHGAYSHAIQLAIILYALDAKDIESHVALSDVLSALVNLETHGAAKKEAVWMPIRDTRDFIRISFTDPHRLFSILMQEGDDFGAPVLANYLRDSFGKAFNKLHQAHCTIIRNISVEEFVAQLNDLQIHLFPSINKMLEHAISLHQIKNHKVFQTNVDNDGTKFAVIEKEYPLENHAFQSQPYTLTADTRLPPGLTQGIYQLRAWLQEETAMLLSDVIDTGYLRNDQLETIKTSHSPEAIYNMFSLFLIENMWRGFDRLQSYPDFCLAALFKLAQQPKWLTKCFDHVHCEHDLWTFLRVFATTGRLNYEIVKDQYQQGETISYNIVKYYMHRALKQHNNSWLQVIYDTLLDYIKHHPAQLHWGQDGLCFKANDNNTLHVADLYGYGLVNLPSATHLLGYLYPNETERNKIYIECVNKLLATASLQNLNSVLMHAIKEVDQKLILSLLEAGIDLKQVFAITDSAVKQDLLFDVVDKPGREWLLDLFLANQLVDINVQNFKGMTAVFWVLLRSNRSQAVSRVQRLLEAGGNCNIGLFEGNFTPLMYTIQDNQYDCFELFLKYKADVNSTFTAPMQIMLKQIIKNEKYENAFGDYVKAKLNVDKLPGNISHISPLQFAVICGRSEMVKMLLAHNATTITTENKLDICELAALLGHDEIKNQLVQHRNKLSVYTQNNGMLTFQAADIANNQENSAGAHVVLHKKTF